MQTLSTIVAIALPLAGLAAAGHALLFKREPQSALGWIAVSLLFPGIGPLSYYLFGINRIRTRAKRLHAADQSRVKHRPGVSAPPRLRRFAEGGGDGDAGPGEPPSARAAPAGAHADLIRATEIVTERRLTTGNRIEMLENGEGAYPAMLDAIDAARDYVYLSTYIFDTDATGRQFVDALRRARERGVRVRVLVDGVGEWYSIPRVGPVLERAGIPVARFLPPRLVPPQANINLRNHRKILVVDGDTAFTGGMNLGDRHLVGRIGDPGRVVDAHFRVRGPVVAQVEEVFREDWAFVTDEELPEPTAPTPAGSARARIIVDGPNEDLDRLASVLMAAFGAAQRRVVIMTPYFLPPRELTGAIKAAALRGVDVTVILPARNNLPFVHWASRHGLWELLQWGVEVYDQPPPFAHTKLLLVDDDYAQVGSANLDPRSLRLNFELTVEIHDRDFAAVLEAYCEGIVERSRRVTFEEIENRPLWARGRDAFCWLFSPYL